MAKKKKWPVEVILSTETFTMNGVSFRDAVEPGKVYEVLGKPSRIIEAGDKPAPVGHRNNQFHVYDQLGMYLNEHHHTGLIEAVTLVMHIPLAVADFETTFRGYLEFGDILTFPGVWEKLLKETSIPFTCELRRSWSAQGKGFSIWVMTKPRKLPDGRRTRDRYISTITVCLKHDPKQRARQLGS